MASVELSLEIPIPLLEEIFPLTDFGFSLAHMIHRDETYRKFYSKVDHLMDNGMYELDEPMTVEDIRAAARYTTPFAIIAPDYRMEAKRTSQLARLTRGHMQEYSVGIVVQGRDLLERIEFCQWAIREKYNPVCFPFRDRNERMALIAAVARNFEHGMRYHLLGLNSTTELEMVRMLKGRWSFDTAKACKPGLDLKTDPWTGHGKIDLYRKYNRDEINLVKENVSYLRAFL